MACELIPDGYTQSDKCHGLNVVFRPMPFGDYDDYMDAVLAAPAKDRKKLIGEKVAERIVSWDATAKGQAVEVTPENINQLPAAAGQRLRNLITGQVAPDNGETQEGNEGNSEAV